MIDNLLNCGANAWLMIAGGVLTFGVLVLAGTALVKYVFFTGRSGAAA
jgi:hypothetical protein